MPELREELIGRGLNKKRIIYVSIVAGLLVSVFAFQTLFFGLIFGGPRTAPNATVPTQTYQYNKTLILPWNLEDLLDLLTPEQLADLIDQFDGDIDDFGFLGAFAALLYADVEVFRVYDYDDFSNMSSVLWRYECFDEYTGDGWTSTSDPKHNTNFYEYADYYSEHPSEDKMKIKMTLQPKVGSNSMVVPTLAPRPFIMEDSFTAQNLNTNLTILYADDFNGTTVDLVFTEGVPENVSMTYELFGLSLPSSQAINDTAYDELLTPGVISSKYLKLPPTIETYKTNNPYFKSHFDALSAIIVPGDNAFMVANKIRNYLQSNFQYSTTKYIDPIDGPQDGEDEVEWFCEAGEGIWTHFASAFCAFSRAFNVASRFIDGFNSEWIEEFQDPDEDNDDTFKIKYKNMYSWAEIYIPTSPTGEGSWFQFDILRESFGEGGNPITGDQFNFTVSHNSTTNIFSRTTVANITATLSSDTGGDISGRTINFYDYTEGKSVGQAITNSDGNASIYIQINNTITAGPHLITASCTNPIANNFTQFIVHGNVTVNITSLNPTTVNISDTLQNSTRIQGYIKDSINDNPIKNATINFALVQKGKNTPLPNAFLDDDTDADNSGNFDFILNVSRDVMGLYEIRADFNGSWNGVLLYNLMNSSSEKVEFNITEKLTYNIDFFIDGTPTNYSRAPHPSDYFVLAQKGQSINLTANITSARYGTPQDGVNVDFFAYNSSSGTNIYLGSGTTGSHGNGTTTLFHTTGTMGGVLNKTGPILVFAKVGNKRNYSYYILNGSIEFDVISGPTPTGINRTGMGTTFNIKCRLKDSGSLEPINFTTINLFMKYLGLQRSNYLNPPYPTFSDLGGSNLFDIDMGVLTNTPAGNYTLELKFDGVIDLTNDGGNPWPRLFNISQFNTLYQFQWQQFKIDAPDIFSFKFYINGTNSTDNYNPLISRSSKLNLTVNVTWGLDLAKDGEDIYFYDNTEGKSIGTAQLQNGTASINYQMDNSLVAGPHLISARYYKYGVGYVYNYSYFILNAPINISLELSPEPSVINSTGTLDTTFLIKGNLTDLTSGENVKYGTITVQLFDGTSDVSYYLTKEYGILNLNDTGEIYLIYSVAASTPQKNYTIRVNFTGTITYGAPKPMTFFLSSNANFTDSVNCSRELQVKDPEDIVLNIKINGTYPLTAYNDGSPIKPPRYTRGQNMSIFVNMSQAKGYPTIGSILRVIDVYPNVILATYTFVGGEQGKHLFIINTSLASMHGGLHLLNVTFEYSGTTAATFNATYVIINETALISTQISTSYVRLRNVNGFTISGNLTENLVLLRGLQVRFMLFNQYMNPINPFNYLDLQGPAWKTINDDGTFSYTINKPWLNCPQGVYYIRIDFNGTLQHSDFPNSISLSNYMVNSSSALIQLNITANTTIIKDGYHTLYESYFPNTWVVGDKLYVYGNLTWDNGTGIEDVFINVTIKRLDGTVITFNATSKTGLNGVFNVTLTIDGSWPSSRSDVEIWAYFYPTQSYGSPERFYILQSENEFT